MTPNRLLVTPGEPAGIGPDIIIRNAQSAGTDELVVIADPDLLMERAKKIRLPLSLIDCDINSIPQPHEAGTLKIIPVKLNAPSVCGKLNPANAPYVLQCLELAAKLCINHQANAIVTGPVHKGVINEAHLPFTGHTEFFAKVCDVPNTVMLFVVDNIKAALVTTHLPLAKVPQAITTMRLQNCLTILHAGLKHQFGIAKPRIAVCGLNPHAGEGGHIGYEEIATITPALNVMRQLEMNISGPYPADTIFTPKFLQRTDAVLAMYHDQALPIIKYIGFGHAVNVTLGLPFVRTSVDHGTALDIAGTDAVDAGSMKAAMALATKILSLKFFQAQPLSSD